MSTILEEPFQAFLGEAEERGTIEESALEAFAAEHDLDDVEASRRSAWKLEAREVDVAAPVRGAPEGYAPSGSTDAMTLFMSRAGRYPLLTAAEEVELAKRIERGDAAAKERMINSNLRLVISIAKRYQGHDVPLGDLVQEGVIGLNRAVEKFDWRRGLSSRLRHVVDPSGLPACDLELVENDPRTDARPRAPAEAGPCAWRAGREARPRANTQTRRGDGLLADSVDEALDAADTPVSLNQRVGSEDQTELGDLFGDPSADDPAEEAVDSVRRLESRRALARLPEHERRVSSCASASTARLGRSRQSARSWALPASGFASSRATR